MNKRLFWLATGIELFGIAIVAFGAGLEVAYGGSIYIVTITIGSLFIAGGSLLFAKFVRRR